MVNVDTISHLICKQQSVRRRVHRSVAVVNERYFFQLFYVSFFSTTSNIVLVSVPPFLVICISLFDFVHKSSFVFCFVHADLVLHNRNNGNTC